MCDDVMIQMNIHKAQNESKAHIAAADVYG